MAAITADDRSYIRRKASGWLHANETWAHAAKQLLDLIERSA